MQAICRVTSVVSVGPLCLALAAPAAASVATGVGQPPAAAAPVAPPDGPIRSRAPRRPGQPPAAAAPVAPPARLVVQSPGTIEFEITIEPTAQTGELRVVADSGAFYRSTTIGLSGEDSRRTHTFEWRGFPAGEYDVVGELISRSGRREVVVRGALLVIDRPRPRLPAARGGRRR